MKYSRIELGQRGAVENIREKYSHCFLSHAFNTLILWQETFKLSIYLEDDFYVVKFGLKGDNSYFFPCGNEDKQKNFIDNHINEKDFRLYYLREEDKIFMEKYYPKSVNIQYDRAGCEYVFDKSDYIALKGKKYSKIRYEQNHLKSNYNLRSEQITHKNIEDAVRIIKSWEEDNYLNSSIDYNDYIVSENVIKYFEAVRFIGNVVYIDDIPYAVAMGGEISKDTFGIYLAKMRKKVSGLMFYLLIEFFKIIPNQYNYVNGDDDMDVEGIRIHKEKMRPLRMNEVWKTSVIQ